eukprot:15990010-Heterocapsa_arctica.AAC.1
MVEEEPGESIAEEEQRGPMLGNREWNNRNVQGTEGLRRNLRDLWNHLLMEAYGASVMCNLEGELRALKALQRIQS